VCVWQTNCGGESAVAEGSRGRRAGDGLRQRRRREYYKRSGETPVPFKQALQAGRDGALTANLAVTDGRLFVCSLCPRGLVV
jgi:hypothetical protein